MIRHAAPLSLTWTAVLAALAATSIGVAATQIVCPVDDSAHHLVGHLAPMALLTLGIAAAGAHPLGGRVAWADRMNGVPTQHDLHDSRTSRAQSGARRRLRRRLSPGDARFYC
jgi:hypothetical protein